ncbi:MAG: hypothetical protein M1330_01820 [Armatimonadetes bacterium]|nr:hypothetical protein [Armatimonadota bacterium]
MELANEVGKLVSERMRSEADRMAAPVRGSLLSVANVTPASPSTRTEGDGGRLYRVPRISTPSKRTTPDGKPPASPKGMCCVCGIELTGSGRYCDTHRREKACPREDGGSASNRNRLHRGAVRHGSNPVDWKADLSAVAQALGGG